MNGLRTFVALAFLMLSLASYGQHLDSVQLDLKHLSDIEFFKKYSFYEDAPSIEDLKVTKSVWSLHHIRRVNKSLSQKGVRTVTIIENRPSKENPYYIIGHYHLLPESDHMFRMSYYRVDTSSGKVCYQSWFDLIKDKWRSVK
jgi:hypothetical protein